MSQEKQQPPREVVQPSAPKVVLQSASAQPQKPADKPDKNARVPKGEMQCFSGSEKEK